MRRLWAHIIIAFATLVAVFACIPSMILKLEQGSINGDYETRRQFTFQLTQREKEDEDDNPKELNDNSAKDIAKIMESRLINYNVTSYDITTSGNDIVTVTFNTNSNDKYRDVVTYLTFSGSFAFVNNQDDLVEEDLFRRGNAYLKEATVNDYPTVILPIKSDSDEWSRLLKGANDNPETEEASSEDEESTTKAVIYLLYNYQKGDTYKTLNEQGKFNDKLFLTFNFEPSSEEAPEYADLYYNSNKNSLSKVCGFQDLDGDGTASAVEVRSAYDQADYLVNLFNASALDYEVECIRGLASGTEVYVQARVEKITNESLPVWNSTLTATVAAFLIVSLLLVVFYRLGAISGIVTTVLSAFASFGFLLLTGLEYNTLAVIGMVVVTIVSLVSAIIYNNKLKEDAYKGHTLKKANTEASKKSLLPIVDVHVVGLALGLMAFLLGGNALHSFGAIVSLGTLVSLLLNTLGLKGMMWLVTNATALTGKYEYFGINSENVPNHMAEEKQRYFGPYADKDLTKKKKPVGIAALATFGVALIGIIVAASVMGGSIYRPQKSTVTNNVIYIQNKIVVASEDSESPLNDTSLYDEILNKIQLLSYDKDNNETETKLATYVTDFKKLEIEESETTESETLNYRTTYYVVNLKQILDLNTPARITGETLTDLTLGEAINSFFTIHELFTSSVENDMSIKTTSTYVNKPYVDWQKVTLATVVAMGIATLYLLLRYRLSRGLASLVFPVAASGISLGLITLFSVIGANIPGDVVITLPIVTLFSYVFAILFMNRERELVLDDKTRDISVEHREELSIQAMGMAYAPMLASAVVGIYLLIDFFGFGPALSSYAYLFAIVGSLVALALISVLYVPVSNWLYRLFHNIGSNRKPREKKKTNKPVVKKSAEPEEAIFIGIND